jgi:hypothetical protein
MCYLDWPPPDVATMKDYIIELLITKILNMLQRQKKRINHKKLLSCYDTRVNSSVDLLAWAIKYTFLYIFAFQAIFRKYVPVNVRLSLNLFKNYPEMSATDIRMKAAEILTRYF